MHKGLQNINLPLRGLKTLFFCLKIKRNFRLVVRDNIILTKKDALILRRNCGRNFDGAFASSFKTTFFWVQNGLLAVNRQNFGVANSPKYLPREGYTTYRGWIGRMTADGVMWVPACTHCGQRLMRAVRDRGRPPSRRPPTTGQRGWDAARKACSRKTMQLLSQCIEICQWFCVVSKTEGWWSYTTEGRKGSRFRDCRCYRRAGR